MNWFSFPANRLLAFVLRSKSCAVTDSDAMYSEQASNISKLDDCNERWPTFTAALNGTFESFSDQQIVASGLVRPDTAWQI